MKRKLTTEEKAKAESLLDYIMTSVHEGKNPCWKGYEQYGMKEKNGKKVPNCVKKEYDANEGIKRSKEKIDEICKYIDKLLEGEWQAEPPSDWDVGFAPENPDSGLKLMKGELPFQVHGRWYLTVWDKQLGDNVVYDYSTDMPIPYDEFQQMVQGTSKPAVNEERYLPSTDFGGDPSAEDKLLWKQKYITMNNLPILRHKSWLEAEDAWHNEACKTVKLHGSKKKFK